MRPARLLTAMLCTLVSATSLQAGEIPLPPGRDSSRELVEAGRQLFTMNFARPERNVVSAGGNGLGPVFNETSCVGCHKQGGVGGGGDNDSNVLLLGIVTRPRRPANIPAAIAAARKIHPGFNQNSAVKVLHRFAVGDPEHTAAYDKWRDGIFADFAHQGSVTDIKPVRKDFGPVTIELAQRNSTALWGVGLIDKFRREGGAVMRQRLAAEQPEKHPGITGRVPKTPGGREGWFGWRGQVATLDDFTVSACAIEMGLQVPGVQEDSVPTASPNAVRHRESNSHLDLTVDQCAALAALVHSFPRPTRPDSSASRDSRLDAGERVFDRIGCTSCHVQDLGFVSGIYSDMLLHDMGTEMSDAQTATPDIVRGRVEIGNGYYNVSIPIEFESETNPEQEWKTPPLWGVSDSAPYLHDGRAATLKEAILMHAGEADRSVEAFKQLDDEDRQALLAFLGSLKAPSDGVAVARR
jgi:CxxC motif-containing protein (DUF1111 family)